MKERIEPHKVTKPIQLLAAWLLGLILIDGSFLSAAGFLTQPPWVSIVLVIAAVCSVPLFLASLFLLQTKFRPEMQEASFYSKYLEVARTTRKPENTAMDLQILRSIFSESNSQTIEAVDRLQTQVIQLTSQVSRITEQTPNAERSIQAVEEISRHLREAQESLERTKRSAQWHWYAVNVNDLLPHYDKIRARLADAAIPVQDTFGSTSQVGKPPNHYVMAFGAEVEVAALQQLLDVLGDAQPDYLDRITDDDEGNQLYIGSYGYENGPVLKLDKPNLEAVLRADSTRAILDMIAHSKTRIK